MTTVLAKSSEKIDPRWVARYRNPSSTTQPDRAFDMHDYLSFFVDRGGWVGQWNAGQRDILEFRPGFNENGPLKERCCFRAQPHEGPCRFGAVECKSGRTDCSGAMLCPGCFYAPAEKIARAAPIAKLWTDGKLAIDRGVDEPVEAKATTCDYPDWCGLPYRNQQVPGYSEFKGMVVDDIAGFGEARGPGMAYCSQLCADTKRAAKVEPSLPAWAPIPERTWIAPMDDATQTDACSENMYEVVPAHAHHASKVHALPDRYGTARTKLERENQMWRPRWR